MILPFGKPPPRAMSSVRAPLEMVSLLAQDKLLQTIVVPRLLLQNPLSSPEPSLET